MADNDTARLKKERAERAALKKRADLEAAARKAEQKARERRDREIKARREQEEVLVGRKNGGTHFLEKRKPRGEKMSQAGTCTREGTAPFRERSCTSRT